MKKKRTVHQSKYSTKPARAHAYFYDATENMEIRLRVKVNKPKRNINISLKQKSTAKLTQQPSPSGVWCTSPSEPCV